MLRYLYIGEACISMREFMINLGTVVGILVFGILLYLQFLKEQKSVKRFMKYIVLPILIEAIIILTLGTICSSIVRGFTNGYEGSIFAFLKDTIMNGGSHFVGTVFVISILNPVCYKYIYSSDYIEIVNISAFFFIIQHGFSRIGCFMEGCCYGIPAKGVWAVSFPSDIVPYTVFPVQLFEVFGMVVLLVLLSYLYLKKKNNTFYVAVNGYAIVIFIAEFFTDQRGTVSYFGLNAIQFTCIVLFVISMTGLLKREK